MGRRTQRALGARRSDGTDPSGMMIPQQGSERSQGREMTQGDRLFWSLVFIGLTLAGIALASLMTVA